MLTRFFAIIYICPVEALLKHEISINIVYLVVQKVHSEIRRTWKGNMF